MTYITGPTGLPVLASTQPDDVLPVVDVHDTSGGTQPYGTTKQITVADLLTLNPALWYANIFGNGSDGAVTLDGTATYSGFSTKASSTYTLTRDVYATSLTVDSGVTLIPGPFRIFCTGTFTNDGTVSCNGGAGSATGAGGASSSTSAGGIGSGATGGAGNTGNGSGGSRVGIALGTGIGGTGGAGASGTGGGAGFSITSATSALTPSAMLSGMGAWGGSTGQISGGPSAGGGGGDGTNRGGGGGGGGGIVCIFAHSAVNAGTITANGGAGGTPAVGNCGGGGGASGGLILIYTLTAWSNTGTTAVSGGAAGSGVGTGAAGNPGNAGSVVNFLLA